MNIPHPSKGISVLEIVIGTAIILILTTAIAGAWRSYIKMTRLANEKNQAAILTEEASEILQFLRDDSWTAKILPLSLNTTYYLVWNGTAYVSTTTASVIQSIYKRTVTFSSVARNAQDTITTSGGTTDVNTRKVTILVTTSETPPEVRVQTEMLIHNVYGN
jgi:Tfp pilus assembly protein PilE